MVDDIECLSSVHAFVYLGLDVQLRRGLEGIRCQCHLKGGGGLFVDARLAADKTAQDSLLLSHLHFSKLLLTLNVFYFFY